MVAATINPGALALVAAVLSLVYIGGQMIYNLYFHPLASFPGPLLARASRLWYINAALRGKLPFSVYHAHAKYGPAVRIAPDELSFDHPDAWRDIYGSRASKDTIVKEHLFYNEHTAFGELSIVSASFERHSRQRRLLSHGFSDKALREQEPIVQDYIDLMIYQLRILARKGEIVDIVNWYNFFTFDIIGELAFGEPFGCLKSGKYHPWIDWMFSMLEGGTWGRCVDYYPLLKRLLAPLIPKSLLEGMQTHKELVAAKAQHRLEMKTDRLDFMTKMAAPDSGITKEEFIGTCDTVILGGSETTGTLLSGVTHFLVQNPEKLKKLVGSVRSAFSSEDEIDIPGVNNLSYMRACLDEAFRLHPPVPGALPRRTLKPHIICGRLVPAETTVGIYQWAMYHNENYFNLPEEYIPERWLDDPQFADDNREVVQPFSVGGRNCIGRNLAYIEMRLALARLLYNFDIEATPACKGWAKQKVFLLWKKPPLWVKLTLRDIKSRPQVVALAEKEVA